MFRSHHDLMSYITNEISLECEKKLVNSNLIKYQMQELRENDISYNDVSQMQQMNISFRKDLFEISVHFVSIAVTNRDESSGRFV